MTKGNGKQTMYLVEAIPLGMSQGQRKVFSNKADMTRYVKKLQKSNRYREVKVTKQ